MSTRWLRQLIIPAVLSGSACAPPMRVAESAPPADSAAERAVAFAVDLRSRAELPALVVAVSRGDQLVLDRAWGWADEERQLPATSETLFRIGSVSKLLTATAALRLADRGRLDLDAPIARYRPDLPADKRSITARQLLGHLSGIHHYGRNDYISTQHYGNVTESLDRFLGDTLLAAPGTRYVYSSYGFNLLGAVLQSAGGTEFRALVSAEVLAPLQLGSIVVEEQGPPAHRARLYQRGNSGRTDAPESDLSDRWPSGGYVATAADLARFAARSFGDRYLSPAAKAAVFTPQHGADGRPTGVGIGWRIAADSLGRRYLHHGGDALGGRAFVLVYPDQGVAVALVANLGFGSITEADARQIAGFFLR